MELNNLQNRPGRTLLGLTIFSLLLYVSFRFAGTLVLAVFIYYAVRPLNERILELIPTNPDNHIPVRTLVTFFSILLFVLPVVLLLIYMVGIGIQQADAFSSTLGVSRWQDYLGAYGQLAERLRDPQQFIQNTDSGILLDRANTLTGYITLIGLGLLHLFVGLAGAFYLLRDDYRLKQWVEGTVQSDTTLTFLSEVDSSFHSVFFGNILNALLTAAIGTVCYNLLTLVAPAPLIFPYPTLLGLLTGIGSLIPVIGMKIVYIPVTAYVSARAAVTGHPELFWFPALIFLVSFLIVDTIPDILLRPYVSGRNIHTGMLMIAYAIGPIVFGPEGLFLAPMLLVVGVQFTSVILPELLQRQTNDCDTERIMDSPLTLPRERDAKSSQGADD